ncbi:pantetheine-phosphate adenylyltransferase [Mycoplasmoides pirum]|uniref:pantetheine-phosphate adenylyltransferase n=1 Tax=Mycoplasmoides pirum TaxID=2122 RepID=UPI0004853A54|nr:pantetheine-phosphate adenylyltransferase [Mycoplasmoides pirum]
MSKKIALFPGSFDPIHIGHIHIIEKASKLFDEVIVCVSINIDKQQKTSLHKRKIEVQKIIKSLNFKNIKVILWSKYIVDAAKKYKAKYLISGVRNIRDMKQQLYNASVNKELNPDLETIVLFSDNVYKSISSSEIKKTILKHKNFFKQKTI